MVVIARARMVRTNIPVRTPARAQDKSATTYLSEPAAWREIHRRIERDESIEEGLCYEIGKLRFDGWIDRATALQMRRRLHRHIRFHNDGKGMYTLQFAFDPGDEWEARSMAALLLAQEAEDEPTLPDEEPVEQQSEDGEDAAGFD